MYPSQLGLSSTKDLVYMKNTVVTISTDNPISWRFNVVASITWNQEN